MEGSLAQWLAFALLDPAAKGSIPGIPESFSDKIFREKVVDVAKDNQRRCCLEQWKAEA